MAPQGGALVWRDRERQVLRLLHVNWDLTPDEACTLFHRVFPYMKKAGRDYSATQLKDEWQHRFKTKKPKAWQAIDRPNKHNKASYTDDELEEQMRLQALIEAVAKDADLGASITLTPCQGASLHAISDIINIVADRCVDAHKKLGHYGDDWTQGVIDPNKSEEEHERELKWATNVIDVLMGRDWEAGVVETDKGPKYFSDSEEGEDEDGD